MGRCSGRMCWVNGQKMRNGYLAEVRMDASARGNFHMLRDGYAFFHALQEEAAAELYFTSIASDNHRAHRLLERGERGFPAHGFVSELATLLVTVPQRPRCARSLRVELATPAR